MRNFVSEQENKRRRDTAKNLENKSAARKKSGGLLLGCSVLAAPFVLGFGTLAMVSSSSAIVVAIGIGLLVVLLGFLMILYGVLWRKKNQSH
jgi:hypothetical protein